MSSISEVMAIAQSTQTSEVSNKASEKSKVSGKTIGNPKLSEKANKYYEELKNKYSNMDFILVSEDQKEYAKAQAGSYANPNKMVVLIDEDKIERMAEDEDYRKQYENIISSASSALPMMSSRLSSTGANVKGYGIQVNDNGTATYFAVLDKSLATQRERIEKKAEEKSEAKKDAKKEASKKAQKEEQQERIEEIKANKNDSVNTVTVTASSLEELLQKINDMMFEDRSNHVRTEKEKKVGQRIDFSV